MIDHATIANPEVEHAAIQRRVVDGLVVAELAVVVGGREIRGTLAEVAEALGLPTLRIDLDTRPRRWGVALRDVRPVLDGRTVLSSGRLYAIVVDDEAATVTALEDGELPRMLPGCMLVPVSADAANLIAERPRELGQDVVLCVDGELRTLVEALAASVEDR
jgi:hypothetical protein